jgi:hypothetical protein
MKKIKEERRAYPAGWPDIQPAGSISPLRSSICNNGRNISPVIQIIQ